MDRRDFLKLAGLLSVTPTVLQEFIPQGEDTDYLDQQWADCHQPNVAMGFGKLHRGTNLLAELKGPAEVFCFGVTLDDENTSETPVMVSLERYRLGGTADPNRRPVVHIKMHPRQGVFWTSPSPGIVFKVPENESVLLHVTVHEPILGYGYINRNLFDPRR